MFEKDENKRKEAEDCPFILEKGRVRPKFKKRLKICFGLSDQNGVRGRADGFALERDLHHLRLLRLQDHRHLHHSLRGPRHPQLPHLHVGQEEA